VLARPKNKFAYDRQVDLAALAAAYLFGLMKNHGYIDGNRRLGFAAAATFLRLNGVGLTASEMDAFETVIGVVEGRLSEEALASWFREKSVGDNRRRSKPTAALCWAGVIMLAPQRCCATMCYTTIGDEGCHA
jgi:death-on-curing protein